MSLPFIAAGIAARLGAKKLATRVVAGIIGAGARQVAPAFRNMEIPKAPPGGKAFNPNPPKPPTGSSIPKKPPHVPEKKDTAIQNQNPKLPSTNKPMILPGKGKSFSSHSRLFKQ